MKTSKELREERAEISKQIDALQNTASTEKRSLNKEEQTKFLELLDTEKHLTRSLEVELEIEKRAATNANVVAPNGGGEEKEMRKFSLGKLVKEISQRGVASGFELEMIQESEKEKRDLGVSSNGGIYLSSKLMDVATQKRTQTAQTGNANLGGSTIPTEKVGFFDALWNTTILPQLGVQSLTGLAANTDLVGWDVAPVAYWAAETGTQSPTDATFANRTLRPKLLGSAVDITMLLNLQTNGSLDAYFMDAMMKAMAVLFEQAVINGDGSNKPTGILGTSGIQNVAMGTDGGAPTLAKILELVQKVQTAGAIDANCKWALNPKTIAKMKQVDIGTDTGAKLIPYNSYFNGMPGVLDGYQFLSSQNVPSNLTKGSSSGVCSAAIFGDFTQVVTAQFGGLLLSIDDVSAAMRRGGKYGITANMFVDSAVKKPEALGAILDLITT